MLDILTPTVLKFYSKFVTDKFVSNYIYVGKITIIKLVQYEPYLKDPINIMHPYNQRFNYFYEGVNPNQYEKKPLVTFV